MNVIQFPDNLAALITAIARPTLDLASVRQTTLQIFEAVRSDGDRALLRYTAEFDKVTRTSVVLPRDEVVQRASLCPPALKKAITQAKSNIEKFHRLQREQFSPIETMPGVQLWRRSTPIERVGLYIPGGSAPLFSTVLMLAIPAKLAGCSEIVLCTPPQADGTVHPAVAFAAELCGITQIACVGGAQAIAAMVFGTESVPKVYKVFGPGNRYVTMAKHLADEYGVAADLPAGPSELAVLADGTANPAFIAADLIAQAEHGSDSHAILVTNSQTVADAVQVEISKQSANLPRRAIVDEVLAHSTIIIVKTMEEAVQVVNLYAPEHLSLEVKDVDTVCDRITNAGSVFIGSYTPEAAGDYASGTNHTLPTGGWAAVTGGVSLESFMKKITYQRLTREGLQALGHTIITMAEAEGLKGHAQAVRIRL